MPGRSDTPARAGAVASASCRPTCTSATTSPASSGSGGTTASAASSGSSPSATRARTRSCAPSSRAAGRTPDRMRLPDAAERADRPRRDRSRSPSRARRSQAFAGDTIGSALYAAGRASSRAASSTTGRAGCSAARALRELHDDGRRRAERPRLRRARARRRATCAAQNVLGSLDRDLLSVVDRFGGPFTPVGFYYRTMIRPRRAWPLYEKFLRNVAGLGRVAGTSDARAATTPSTAASTCS